jgi:hypothetical protein
LTEDFIEVWSEPTEDVPGVSGMLHDGFIPLKKYYDLRTRDTGTLFSGSLVEKVNGKKIDLTPINSFVGN